MTKLHDTYAEPASPPVSAAFDPHEPSAIGGQDSAASWLRDNKEALQASNDYVARQGLPLARFRQF